MNSVSFIEVKQNCDFTIHNIPFGVYQKNTRKAVCTRLGDMIIDLDYCQAEGLFDDLNLPKDIFLKDALNDFMALGKKLTNHVRIKLQEALKKDGFLDSEQFIQSDMFIHWNEVEMLLPINVGDYTDFYSSREHATNVGTMFRGADNALMPNWLHLPVGYHGRASSIVVSGTPIKRPKGQMKRPDLENPHFGPTQQLDFELEVAFVIGKNSVQGDSVSTSEAEDYIFGLMLFNDWSARDIQSWEYVPLGPFLGKSFASTVSPWVVTLEALEPFRIKGPVQNPEVLPYLQYNGSRNYDINLSVDLETESGANSRICTSNFKYLYWNMCQQLAHHTVNGCNLRVGDMMASGTISGSQPDSFGSMLELTWRGTRPLKLTDGSERKFFHDGDNVKMRGWCEKDGVRIGFGPCDGTILE